MVSPAASGERRTAPNYTGLIKQDSKTEKNYHRVHRSSLSSLHDFFRMAHLDRFNHDRSLKTRKNHRTVATVDVFNR